MVIISMTIYNKKEENIMNEQEYGILPLTNRAYNCLESIAKDFKIGLTECVIKLVGWVESKPYLTFSKYLETSAK